MALRRVREPSCVTHTGRVKAAIGHVRACHREGSRQRPFCTTNVTSFSKLIAAQPGSCSSSVKSQASQHDFSSEYATVQAWSGFDELLGQVRTFHFSMSSCLVLYCFASSTRTLFMLSALDCSCGSTSPTVRSTSTPLIMRKHLRVAGRGVSVSRTSLEVDVSEISVVVVFCLVRSV